MCALVNNQQTLISEGFKTVEIEPALGKLSYIKGQMPHPAGIISFDLRRSGIDKISGEIILPEGLTGKFTWKGKSIVLSGRTTLEL